MVEESARDEQLYGDYLDQVLAGNILSPEAFLAEQGDASPELLERLVAIHTMLQPTRSDGQEASSSPESEPGHEGLPFSSLGDFRLIRKLDAGGMGVVYVAEQVSLGRLVALKVIRPEYADSPAALARFEREARAVARLRHDNIVSIHAVGSQDGTHYLAMELIPGQGLDELLDGVAPPISPMQAVAWAADLAEALHYAHGEGIVHRDVKPSNVRITTDGRPILVDFGLARDLNGGSLTMTGAFVGSPHYVAPERIEGGQGLVDARTDVYSLGVTLYECVTGHVPFRGDSVEQVFHRILVEDPPPPRGVVAAISRDLEIVLLAAMEKDPSRRYVTARAFAEDLRALLEFRPIQARPPGRVARIAKWSRRHRGVAAGLAVALASLLLFAGSLAWSGFADQRERQRQATEALDTARAVIDAYRDGLDGLAAMEEKVSRLADRRFNVYFEPDEDRQLDDNAEEFERARREREGLLVEVRSLTAEAERLGADPGAVRDVLAQMHLARYLEAIQRRDTVAEAIQRELVERFDPERRYADELAGRALVSIVSDPPGAEVFVFREVSRDDVAGDGQRRLVPLPLRAAALPDDLPEWGLRVARGDGALTTEDLILDVLGHPVRGSVLVARGRADVARGDRLITIDDHPIASLHDVALREGRSRGAESSPDEKTYVFVSPVGDSKTLLGTDLVTLGIDVTDPRRLAEAGDVTAQVRSGDRLATVELPAGTNLRTTAAPLLLGGDARVGRTPVEPMQLVAGSYLLVLVAEGYETQRAQVRLWRKQRDRRIEWRVPLVPRGTTPPGFVRAVNVVKRRECTIQEREVTMREYLEFLDDPVIREQIEASGGFELVPRGASGAPGSRYVSPGPDGRYVPPDDLPLDGPVLGVSWSDANAYCAWRTGRDQARGLDVEYALPDSQQWNVAAGDADQRQFVFGDGFRPKWVSSCFARPTPYPEPVMSFPIDESVYGVFDMCGSVAEYLDEWLLEPGGQRAVAGGSWGFGGPEPFSITARVGADPEQPADSRGFRLVLRRPGDAGEDR